ncbi:C39 family peptidase [Sporolactobacillus nakayamae]|uniref:Uncharacterized protein YvpB n=1 Tax=Sporolactobacillus nakayamae TaxID=269670 RepID=A0A1I2NDL2_9BACL|nr:C39 family peptidase [Sporolactobacillus nakayamae]SFF99451.1 Uncharacterized protein YvpB [Sporolactobacillus nakayamae]
MYKRLKSYIIIAFFLSIALQLFGCSLKLFGETASGLNVKINVKSVPKTIHLGEHFDPKKNVTVTNQKGEKQSLKSLKVSGHVDTKRVGTYKLTYTFKSGGVRTSLSKKVQVIYEKKVSITFKTKNVEKSSMVRGKTTVHQTGIKGSKLVRYQAKIVGSKVVLGKAISEKVINEPVTKIIYSGTKIPKSYRMNVAVIGQLPELPAGCEITAVTMMLRYKGARVTKVALAEEMPRATNGDPNTGFVGSPYSKSGMTIYPPALMYLVKKYAGNSANLTGASTDKLKDYLSKDHPIVIWGTYDGFYFHALVLTGYTENGFYYNDPWTDTKRWMNNEQMLIHWNALDRRALTY